MGSAITTTSTSNLALADDVAGDPRVEALIQTADSQSPLVRIICEQIIQAYDWCRQHQRDKDFVILNGMVGLLSDFRDPGSLSGDLRAALLGTGADEQTELLEERLENKGYCIDSLRATAMCLKAEQIRQIDSLIDRQFKTARQLEKSLYEMELRPLAIKRMQLHLEEMERDLKAIEHDNPEAA